jgi:hypothetical protein
MNNKFIYISILLAFLFKSCTETEIDYLKQSLTLSGVNHPSLEIVLSHYKENPADSLKYRAAVFLISNMAPHFSYDGEGLKEYYDVSDSITKYYADNSAEEIQAAFNSFSFLVPANPRVVGDLQVIKADYLIDNIDRAFDLWQNENYARHLDFDEFCEYLLPYKACELQTLDDWREYLSAPEYGDLQYMRLSAHSNHSSYWACDKVNLTLADIQPKVTEETSTVPIRRMNSLLTALKKKDCEDLSCAATSVMRAKGIPVMMDFTPQWANRRLGHSWCVVLDNAGNNLPFEGMCVLGATTILNLPLSKVFRKCYAINPKLLELNRSSENVPLTFCNVCIKDVTDEYQRTDDLSLDIEKTGNKYAYLATFNDEEWFPIHYGKVKENTARFEKMGRDVVYLPVVTSSEGIKPVAQPFLLTLRGEVKPIIPDIDKKQTLKLYRKHPAQRYTSFDAQRTIGSRFQAANRIDFSDAVTIHVVDKFGTESDEILLNPDKKYRYWQHMSAPKGCGAMAEIYFFNKGVNITKKGKIIGTAGKEKSNQPSQLFDNDPVTFFDAPTLSDGWGGLDFGEPVSIDRILYAPKCDGNCITYSDEYELSYWNNHRWNSLGKKTADNIHITFENCPTKALFLLHDCTRGVEDRIFTYEDGKQVFW